MEKPANSTILNVCILPPEEVAKECLKISNSLAKDKVLFTLGNDKFPHMTVFMARFSDEQILNVISALDEISQSISSFRCQHTGYFITAGGYLEVSFKKTIEFINFHKSITEKLREFRINPGHPYEESYFAPYTPEQKYNAEQTGYDLANELYRPHITLTRYKEGHTPQELPYLPNTDLSFGAGKIGLYKADDNGAVYEEIKSYDVSYPPLH